MISSRDIVEAAIQVLDDAEEQGLGVLTISSVGLLNRTLWVDRARVPKKVIEASAMSEDARIVLLQGLRRSNGKMDVGVVQHKISGQRESITVFVAGHVGHRGGQIDAIFEPPTGIYGVDHVLLFGPSNLTRYKGDRARDGRRRMRQPEQELMDAKALIALARLALGLD